MLSGPGGAGVRLSWPWLVSADRDGDGDGWARRSAGVGLRLKRVCGCAGVRVSWPWPVSADRDGDGDGWARRSAGVRQAAWCSARRQVQAPVRAARQRRPVPPLARRRTQVSTQPAAKSRHARTSELLKCRTVKFRHSFIPYCLDHYV